MSYTFLDAGGVERTADSSFVSGTTQRPIVNIGSIVGDITFSPSSVFTYQSGITRSSALSYVLRNDTIASSLGVDLTYRVAMSDSAGRIVTKPYAPSEALVQGVGSTVNIAKSSLLAVSGTGLRNYITDILVANTGSVATLVSFSDSDGSVIGRTIAPATSGSNIRLGTPMRTGSLNSQVEFTAQTASSVLHVTAFGYKAP